MMAKFTNRLPYLFSGSATTAICLCVSPVAAYAADRVAAQAEGSIEQIQDASRPASDIVVTGSRVQRDGNRAPTPVSVLGAEFIQASGALNVADALNELPAFANSATPVTTTQQVRAVGFNLANLRGLGSNRTLTLVDGIRHVPSVDSGEVDLNLIPAIMIDRVDVVTGGAAAVYGSDAVAGVVNLILKRDFVGLRAEIQAGISQYGDAAERRAAILAGTSFSGGRGHFQIAGEFAKNDGVGDYYNRPWGLETNVVTNPTPGGRPIRFIANHVRPSTMAPGGIITAGPLRGTTFDANGQPRQFNYGTLVGSQYMVGGDNQGFGLAPLKWRGICSA